jgi:hypothetical protein
MAINLHKKERTVSVFPGSPIQTEAHEKERIRQ